MDIQMENLLNEALDFDLYQMVISNPRRKDGITKIKIRPVILKEELVFQETDYEGTKVFHKNYGKGDIVERILKAMSGEFGQCDIEHRKMRATILCSKKGKVTIRCRRLEQEKQPPVLLAHNRVKKYLLKEGIPVPFLIDLGVQTPDGQIVRARYDKFKQINRFLEFIEDILPTLSRERTVQIIDFGCGKSYLTFAMYYYLHEIQKYDVEITGLDLKEDVIENCNELSRKYGYEKLRFEKGNIADYQGKEQVDMVVTLHACDTATDYALEKAVKWNARVILSVPCCQHEVNKQIRNEELEPVLRYGIVKERIAALVTDALRADMLEMMGYETDILEFIDMSHTPKNLLIRAIRKENSTGSREERRRQEAAQDIQKVMEYLHIDPTLSKLFRENMQ